MGQDYYKLLGLSKDATEAQLKSAYKKAALKHHPDRNPNDPEGASKKFKEVSEVSNIAFARPQLPSLVRQLTRARARDYRPTKRFPTPTSVRSTTNSVRRDSRTAEVDHHPALASAEEGVASPAVSPAEEEEDSQAGSLVAEPRSRLAVCQEQEEEEEDVEEEEASSRPTPTRSLSHSSGRWAVGSAAEEVGCPAEWEGWEEWAAEEGCPTASEEWTSTATTRHRHHPSLSR